MPSNRAENCLLPEAPGHDPGGAGGACGSDTRLHRPPGSSQHLQGSVSGYSVRHRLSTGGASLQISVFRKSLMVPLYHIR